MHITNIDQWKRNVAIEVIRRDFLKARLVSGGAFLAIAGLFLILAANNTFSLNPAFPRQYSILSRWIGGAFTTVGIFTFHFGIMKPRVEKEYIHPTASYTENDWKELACKMLSFGTAEILYQSRKSWKQVVADLNTPLQAKSSQLRSDIVDKDFSNDTMFCDNFQEALGCERETDNATSNILLCLRNTDVNKLRDALIHLQKKGNLHFLNSRCVLTPLEFVAEKGLKKNIAELVAFGAKDPLYVEGSHSNKVRNSALFEAARHGHSKVVKLLLEHGSQVDLVKCMSGNREMHCFVHLVKMVGVNFSAIQCQKLERKAKAHPIMKEYDFEAAGYLPQKKLELIECFILLVNAWKAQKGSEYVVNDVNAKRAVVEAVMAGHLELADLLIAMGIKAEISEDQIETCISNAIKDDDLASLQWISNHFTVDFNGWRSTKGGTWLHGAAAYNAPSTFPFLKQFIPEDIRNDLSLTYLDIYHELLPRYQRLEEAERLQAQERESLQANLRQQDQLRRQQAQVRQEIADLFARLPEGVQPADFIASLPEGVQQEVQQIVYPNEL